MRQNGLRASSFVPVADVDPRVADQLLDLLAFAHVAAYAEAVPGHTGAYRDHHVSGRPMDRLWVDRDNTAAAHEVLERSLPHLQAELETAITEGTLAGPVPGVAVPHGLGAGLATPEPPSDGTPGPGAGERPAAGDDLPDSDVEDRWREIVAGWEGPTAAEPAPRPGVVIRPVPPPAAPASARSGPARTGTSGTGSVPAGPRDSVAPAAEEHFVPPPPVRHPPVTTATRLGWAAVVTGPLVLVVVVVFGQYLPGWLPVLGVALLVGGFVLLVTRLHRSDPDDDSEPPDDGAVV